MHKADLGTLVEAFFCKRLISQGRASPHTIAVETGKIVNRCSGRSYSLLRIHSRKLNFFSA